VPDDSIDDQRALNATYEGKRAETLSVAITFLQEYQVVRAFDFLYYHKTTHVLTDPCWVSSNDMEVS
jgi:hypothetical protein